MPAGARWWARSDIGRDGGSAAGCYAFRVAILTHLRTGRRVTLSPETVVGRSPECRVSVSGSVVSAHHAAVRWHGEAWWVRDLGSRPGTWLAGRPLGPGEAARLVQGSTLGFGTETDPWVIEDSGEPRVLAERLGDGTQTVATGTVLLLPDDEHPTVAIVQQATGHWHLDDGSDTEVHDGQILEVDGHRWRVSLPVMLDRTVDAKVRSLALHFRVSSDEEYVEIDVIDGDHRTTLRPRSFNYLLLTLARLRLDDAEHPEPVRGWVDQERLARMLDISFQTVNVQLYRARKALGQVREDLATRIVERQSRQSKLRFGLEAVTIERA